MHIPSRENLEIKTTEMHFDKATLSAMESSQQNFLAKLMKFAPSQVLQATL